MTFAQTANHPQRIHSELDSIPVRILEYLLVVLLVLSNNSVFLFIESKVEIQDILVWIALALAIIAHIYSRQRIQYQHLMIFMGGYALYQLWFIEIRFDGDPLSYFLKYVLFFLLLVYYLTLTKTHNTDFRLLAAFSKVVTVLAALSLVIWLIGPVLHILESSGSITMKWGGEQSIPSYFGLHFITQSERILGFTIVRNTGIFPEGPIFGLNLLLAIGFNLFLAKRVSYYKLIILAAALVSTFTTLGMLYLTIAFAMKIALIVFSHLTKNAGVKIVNHPILWSVSGIVAILAIASGILFMNKMGTGSYLAHLDDYVAGFKAWQENILFGHGFDNMDAIIEHMGEFRMENTGYSNSTFLVLAQGGLFLGVFYFFPILSQIKYSIKNGQHSRLAEGLFYLIIFTSYVFSDTYFAVFYLAIGWKQWLIRKSNLACMPKKA